MLIKKEVAIYVLHSKIWQTDQEVKIKPMGSFSLWIWKIISFKFMIQKKQRGVWNLLLC